MQFVGWARLFVPTDQSVSHNIDIVKEMAAFYRVGLKAAKVTVGTKRRAHPT